MNVNELIDFVGREAFEGYSRRSWASAARTGQGQLQTLSSTEDDEGQSQADYDLAVDLVDHVLDLDIDSAGKINFIFELYRLAPNYTWLNELESFYIWDLEIFERTVFWAEMARLISDEDKRLVTPACYLLWCGPFEQQDQVDEAWKSLLGNELSKSGYESLLSASGPVPYRLKRKLYDKLISDKEMHLSILNSLICSVNDACGQIDIKDALRVIENLDISGYEDYLRGLKNELQKLAP